MCFVYYYYFLLTNPLCSQELEVIKEQNASLQIEVLHLQEEVNVTQGKIRKVKNVSLAEYHIRV
jgi:hypothetical protein